MASSSTLSSFPSKTYSISREYIILPNVLGVGVNGKVVMCEHKEKKTKCALKILKDSPKARLEIELHWKCQKDCEYIVQIHDIFQNLYCNVKCLLIVMERMEGGELFTRIQRRMNSQMTEKMVAEIVNKIAHAIKRLHSQNIAHRDLKPENLLYSTKDQHSALKLSDFGFAKEVECGKSLKTPCYTPYYVAPEVLGRERYDKSCDMWSLGVITYILLCGYPPFYSRSGLPISPGMKNHIKNGSYSFSGKEWKKISPEPIALIKNLLCTDPTKRLTIEEVMENNWIEKCNETPSTLLKTTEVMNEDSGHVDMIKLEMETALASMRISPQVKKISDIKDSKNPLLERRRNKKTK